MPEEGHLMAAEDILNCTRITFVTRTKNEGKTNIINLYVHFGKIDLHFVKISFGQLGPIHANVRAPFKMGYRGPISALSYPRRYG
jgi:hypothetical protein